MTYNRPWKSFDDQLALLEQRGMNIGDRAAARAYLERIGYYRLSAYWYPFRQFTISQDAQTRKVVATASNQFHADTHFLDAVHLYLFDKHLRLLLLDALERIEVAVRVDMAHLLGKRNTFAYRDKSEFHPRFSGRKNRQGVEAFTEWQNKYAGLLARSKEDFVSHYRKHHGQDLPVWVAIEVWDFGALSQLFAMMKVSDQEHIARKYGVDDFGVFASWLRSLNYLRNLAAHHSRVWNRNIVEQPKLPVPGAIHWCDAFIGKADLIAKPFLLLAILRHMVRVVCPNTEWHLRIQAHLQGFPTLQSSQQRTVADMGVTANWENWWL